jgi:two-component system cell cycle sensor histidine kinase/response regulator CckA
MEGTSVPDAAAGSRRTYSKGILIAIGSFVVITGSLVLSGWLLDVPSLITILPWSAPMSMNSSICFLLLGTCVLLSCLSSVDRPRLRLAIAALVTLLGLLTFAHYCFGVSSSLEWLLVKTFATKAGARFPVRMSVMSSVSFTCLGAAVMTDCLVRGRDRTMIFQSLTVLVMTLAYVTLIGHIYSITVLKNFGQPKTIAIPTTINLLLLPMAILLNRPNEGLMSLVLSRLTGGLVLRRFLVFILLVPFLAGGIVSDIFQRGLLSLPESILLIVTGTTFTLSCLLILNALTINRGEAEKVRIMRVLEESENRYRRLVENTPDLVYRIEFDPMPKFAYANPSSKTLFGTDDPRELLLRVHPDDRPLLASAATRSGGAARPLIVRFNHCADGRLIWMEMRNTPVYDETGGCLALEGTGRDVSERIRAEDALKKSEVRFKNIFEYSAVSLWERDISGLRAELEALKRTGVTDLRRHISENPDFIENAMRLINTVDVNKLTLRLYEAERKEDLQGPFDLSLGPDVTACVTDLVLSIADGRTYFERETSARTLRGRRLRIIISAYIPEMANEYQHMLESVIDITERKQSETALQTAKEYAENLIQTANTLVMGWDTLGNITIFNRTAQEVTGYAKAELERPNWMEILAPPKRYPAFWKEYASAKKRAYPRNIEATIFTKSGEERNVLWQVSEVKEQGKVVGEISFGIDVTERKRGEQERVKLEEQLLQAQKMESIGLLAGGIAHDFNNLLTIILGFGDVMQKELPEGDPQRSNLTEMMKAARKAAVLTSQLLAFSRKQVLRPSIIAPNEIVKNIEKMLLRLLGEDIELATFLHPEAGNVKADQGQIEQVIMNLAVNARDAMPKGGKLTIEVGNCQLDEAYTKDHKEIGPGEYVAICVSDTGTGIEKESLPRIFEPFFTTKEKGKGTGMGLATVYGIVKQSGGSTTVYSEPGVGTTFKVYLPRVKEESERHAAPAKNGKPRGGEETIVLVEDDESLLNLVARALRDFGYRVIPKNSPLDALAPKTAEEAGRIDLLVTDVVMPKMNGRELANKMLERTPGLKVLFISGYADHAIVHDGVLDDGIAFLQKPFSSQTLGRRIREILDAPPPRKIA